MQKTNSVTQQEISIPVNPSFINGNLTLIEQSKGIIIFAHGSGSSRFSSRNIFVADILNKSGFSTFLFDLLTQEEEAIDIHTREFRFNIPLLAERLIVATQWVQSNPETSNLKIGYFGASTGAAAALIAAAQLPSHISAVVSRGGRPDLALPFLRYVKSPTLLIVGALDHDVIELNQFALDHLQCEKKMSIVPGASHLFEEGTTLQEAAQLAVEWFAKYMR